MTVTFTGFFTRTQHPSHWGSGGPVPRSSHCRPALSEWVPPAGESAPIRGPAKLGDFGWLLDALGAFALERKHRALRIDAAHDPALVLKFQRPLQHPAASLFHPLDCDRDVGDLKIVQPERDGSPWELSEHPTNRAPARDNELVRVEPILPCARLPAEQFAVEGERLFSIRC